ncbi:MAG: RdgB/HAM1 family non-canonical purine NTP pyrophosphatase [Coriobacteriales bacterium]|jgi:XTP/dITP diphosphohydrolase|nr:RdgB/HAM1 family non-canonical purine NTP pyrophosphatase [Coriobacteriales bacterium]
MTEGKALDTVTTDAAPAPAAAATTAAAPAAAPASSAADAAPAPAPAAAAAAPADAPPRLVVVATHNAHKVPEIAAALDMPGWELVPLAAAAAAAGDTDAGDTDADGSGLGAAAAAAAAPVEDADSFEGNALIKARHAFAYTHRATLADDSGLEVDALDGAPGVHSARYAGDDATDDERIRKLLAALAEVPEARRGARFVCALAFIDEEGNEFLVRGVCEGRIASHPRGTGGFGYDPVFLPADVSDGRTMAELTAEEKNALSHRGRALRALRARLGPPCAIRIAVFDFDGTILEGHSPVRMVYRLFSRRVIPFGVALKVLWWGVRYRLRFPVRQEVVRSYIFASFGSLTAREVDALMADLYHDELAALIRPAARSAMQACREAGEKTVIVSASFRPLLEQTVLDLGADWFICTEMEVLNGLYTGRLLRPAPEGKQKIVQLRAWADETFGVGHWRLVRAFGDHYSDEPLLAAAEAPVAVNPDTLLERIARQQGWRIVDWSIDAPES